MRVAERLERVLRRTRGPGAAGAAETVLVFEDLELDQDSYEVRRDGHLIELSPTEFRLLRYLMLHPGRVLIHTQRAVGYSLRPPRPADAGEAGNLNHT